LAPVIAQIKEFAPLNVAFRRNGLRGAEVRCECQQEVSGEPPRSARSSLACVVMYSCSVSL
jgi:hypothetical protein